MNDEATRLSRNFIDTNIFVYASDHREPIKQAQAHDILRRLAEEGELVLSAQVISEYAAVALKKLDHEPAAVAQQVRMLAGLEVVPLTPDLICLAIAGAQRHQLSYCDACILAAAASAGCSTLYTEDLNVGQVYDSVLVVNPFG